MLFPFSNTVPKYSKKALSYILHPTFIGSMKPLGENISSLHLLCSQEGSLEYGNILKLFILIDTDDFIIADCKFLVFGHPSLIAIGQTICLQLIRKHASAIMNLEASHIEQVMRDKNGKISIPRDTMAYINLAVDVLDSMSQSLSIFPNLSKNPMSIEGEITLPNWLDMKNQEKLLFIEQILDAHIRPFLIADGGNISILNIKDDFKIEITYEGSCTSCFSSIDGTLKAIQEVLCKHIHPNIVVIPNYDNLQF